MIKRMVCMILTAFLLAGCSASPKDTEAVSTAPAQTTPLPQTTEPIPTDPEPYISIENAPGKVYFRIGGRDFSCGQPVADILTTTEHVHADVEALVQPLGYSQDIRLRLPDEAGDYTRTVYFSAVNPTQEPLAVKDCLIYSLAVNCETGHNFGLGENSFVTGQTTDEQIIAAWGEPTSLTVSHWEGQEDGENFRDLVYYRPFSYLQIITRGGVVDQVRAYHGAELHGALSQQEAPGEPWEADALLLLSRHMDITPYLNGGKGGVAELPMEIEIEGKVIKMGVRTRDLPQPWRRLYENAACIMKARRCIYSQFPNQEGFIFGNPDQALMERFEDAQIKGIHAFNPLYSNRGYAQSAYRGFTYSGFDHTATIEEVVQTLGLPYEVYAENGPGWCFVWLHFVSSDGDTLRLKVDPESNQLIELRLEENSRFYFYP